MAATLGMLLGAAESIQKENPQIVTVAQYRRIGEKGDFVRKLGGASIFGSVKKAIYDESHVAH